MANHIKSRYITIVQSGNTALSGKNQKSLGIQHPTFQEPIPGHANVGVAGRKQGDILKVHIAFCMTVEAMESSYLELNARSSQKSHKAKPTGATFVQPTIQSRKQEQLAQYK